MTGFREARVADVTGRGWMGGGVGTSNVVSPREPVLFTSGSEGGYPVLPKRGNAATSRP